MVVVAKAATRANNPKLRLLRIATLAQLQVATRTVQMALRARNAPPVSSLHLTSVLASRVRTFKMRLHEQISLSLWRDTSARSVNQAKSRMNFGADAMVVPATTTVMEASANRVKQESNRRMIKVTVSYVNLLTRPITVVAERSAISAPQAKNLLKIEPAAFAATKKLPYPMRSTLATAHHVKSVQLANSQRSTYEIVSHAQGWRLTVMEAFVSSAPLASSRTAIGAIATIVR